MLWLAILFYLPVRKVNYSSAQRLHSTHIMANEQHSPPVAGHVLHLRQALFLETGVTNCQNFIYQQDVSFQMRRNRERQPHMHARRVVFHWRVDEAFNISKTHHFIEFSPDLSARHAQNCSVEKNIFPPRQFRMKPGAHFKQTRDSPSYRHPPLARHYDAAQDLQKRTLAGAIVPDDADNLSAVDLEAEILQCPDRFSRSRTSRYVAKPFEGRGHSPDQSFAQRIVALL